MLKLTADLKVPFRLGPDLYRRDETHVHEAVREALVNTLIHADYEGRTAILVTKEPGRFAFRNPGVPRLALEQIRQGGLSDCRNRRLQKMFLMLGIGEQAGSGFSKILRAWREEQWQSPGLAEDVELETTTLTLSMTSLLLAEVVEALQRRFGRELDGLPGDARMALALAQGNGSVTHERLREVSAGHPRDLTLMLQTLLRKGMLEKEGRGKKCTYRLPLGPITSGSGLGGPHSTSSRHSLLHSGSNSVRCEPSSVHKAGDSVRNGASLIGDSGGDEARSAGQQEQNWWALPEVRAVRGTRRTGHAAVERAIIAACRDRFLALPELAGGLRRNPGTLRIRYVTRLVAAGRLVLLHPEAPNHPHQAYGAAASTGAGGDDAQ